MHNTIDEITLIPITHIPESRGELTVVEKNDIPFTFRRVFTVKANAGNIRGNHAHKECKQFMICLNGNLEILIDDGYNKKSILLSKPNQGVLVPNGIWCTIKYLKNDTILMVLCDQDYYESDYLRNYDDFIKYIGK